MDAFHERITWLDLKYKKKQTRTFNRLPKAILEIKGMHIIFQKKKGKKMLKKGKIFGNLGKNVQDLKIFRKRAVDCV